MSQNSDTLQRWYRHALDAGFVALTVKTMTKEPIKRGWQGGRKGLADEHIKPVSELLHNFTLLKMPSIIRRLATGRNVGVGIHRHSPNLLIIEADNKQAELWITHCGFPSTLTWATARGGLARLYRLSEGHAVAPLKESQAEMIKVGGEFMGELGMRHLGSYQVGPGSRVGKEAYISAGGKITKQFPEGDPPWFYKVHTIEPVALLEGKLVELLEEASKKRQNVTVRKTSRTPKCAAKIGDRDNKIYGWIMQLVYHPEGFTYDSIRRAAHELNESLHMELPMDREVIDYKVDRACEEMTDSVGRREVVLVKRDVYALASLRNRLEARGFETRINIRNYNVEGRLTRPSVNPEWQDRRYEGRWFNIFGQCEESKFRSDVLDYTTLTPQPKTGKQAATLAFDRPTKGRDTFNDDIMGVASGNIYDPFMHDAFVPAIVSNMVIEGAKRDMVIDDAQAKDALLEVISEIEHETCDNHMLVKGRKLVYGEDGRVRFEALPQVLKETSIEPRVGSVVDAFFHDCFCLDYGEDDEQQERSRAAIVLSRAVHRGIALRTIIPGCKHELRGILTGGGGFGKTEFLQKFLGSNRWVSSSAEISRGAQKLLESLGECVLLVIDEVGAMTRDGYDEWKRISSMPQDTFRWPYARRSDTMQRRFVTMSASNLPQPLPYPRANISGDFRREIVVDVRAKHPSREQSATHTINHVLATVQRRIYEGFIDAIAGLPNYIPSCYEDEQERRNFRFCKGGVEVTEEFLEGQVVRPKGDRGNERWGGRPFIYAD